MMAAGNLERLVLQATDSGQRLALVFFLKGGQTISLELDRQSVHTFITAILSMAPVLGKEDRLEWEG
jgi:hypothetical protein